MGHRGPDGQGQIRDAEQNVSLEHCRLAIIDPANDDANQPFGDSTGRWLTVYNGEIFNYRELRADLERRGKRFRTHSDTEVLLESVIADGDAAFDRVRGMFACVIWDRETGEIVAARDPIGVKPLYYAITDGMLVAASELRTVIGHPSLRPKLDPTGVVEYLAFGHTGDDRTLLEGVHKLQPGHLLRSRHGAVTVDEYWDPLPAEPVPEDDLEAQLSELLEAGVLDSLVSDVPISLMLSGGLDSSTLAVLAARHLGSQPLTAYSVSFGLESDESGAAARLAGELGIRFREIPLRQETIAEHFDEWLDEMDVPSANPTWIAISHIARAVHAEGGKVLLSGDGGDELLGGYNRWMRYLRFHDRIWAPTPRRVRQLTARAAAPALSGLAGDIARRAADGGELFVGSRPIHDHELAGVLGSVGREAAVDRHPEYRVGELRRDFDERCPEGDYLAWMSYVGLKHHLVEDFLARLDKMGMAASVEGRVPLLDSRLVKWSFGVPQALKVGRYRQKDLMRRAVAGIVPPYVLEARKQGFCPPVADWAASQMAQRVPQDSILYDEGLLAPGSIAELAQRNSNGGAFGFWTVGTLAAWCQRNL
jgi:asparagine synthase (glutamine-hydrolysing)